MCFTPFHEVPKTNTPILAIFKTGNGNKGMKTRKEERGTGNGESLKGIYTAC